MSWLTRARDARRDKILAVLADGDYHSGIEICRSASLPTGSIHPDLAKLEKQGRIGSRWMQGPLDPRKFRAYFLIER